MPFGLSMTPCTPSCFRHTCLLIGLRHSRRPPTSSIVVPPKKNCPSPRTSVYIANLPPFIISVCSGACATPIFPPKLITSYAHNWPHVPFLATPPLTKDTATMMLPHAASSSPVMWSLMKLCFRSLSTIPHIPMNPMIFYSTLSPHTRCHLRSIEPVASFTPLHLPR